MMKNIETFPSKQMYLYLPLVERKVVEFYNQGGVTEVGKMKNETISPLMFPLNLTENEVNDLVEFLKTLTGSNMDTLVLDAFAAPVGDVSLKDPNWFHDNKLKY